MPKYLATWVTEKEKITESYEADLVVPSQTGGVLFLNNETNTTRQIVPLTPNTAEMAGNNQYLVAHLQGYISIVKID